MSKIWQAEKEYQLTKQKLKKQCLVQGTALGVLSMCNVALVDVGQPERKVCFIPSKETSKNFRRSKRSVIPWSPVVFVM